MIQGMSSGRRILVVAVAVLMSAQLAAGYPSSLKPDRDRVRERELERKEREKRER